MKATADSEFVAEAKKRDWGVNPVSGEKLEAVAKEVIVQPPEVIARTKKLFGN